MELHVGGSNNIILFFQYILEVYSITYLWFDTFDYSTFDTFVLSNSNICNKIWYLFLDI